MTHFGFYIYINSHRKLHHHKALVFLSLLRTAYLPHASHLREWVILVSCIGLFVSLCVSLWQVVCTGIRFAQKIVFHVVSKCQVLVRVYVLWGGAKENPYSNPSNTDSFCCNHSKTAPLLLLLSNHDYHRHHFYYLKYIAITTTTKNPDSHFNADTRDESSLFVPQQSWFYPTVAGFAFLHEREL